MSADRNQLINRLLVIAGRLPDGLLHRLVLDAQMFEDWHNGKKKARGHGRFQQFERWQDKAEDKRFKDIKKRYGGL